MECGKLKWWHVSWMRVILGLALAFGLMGVGCLALWVFEPWELAHELTKSETALRIIPQPVPDSSIAAIDGLNIQHFDFSFQVPWRDADIEKNSRLASVTHFKRGIALIVFDPTGEPDLLQYIRGKSGKDAEAAKLLLGARALSSRYDLMAAEFAATPDDVHWWASREQNARSLVLLNMKSMDALGANAIFKVSNEEMHGFQVGNPAVAPYKIELYLFDRADRRYWIMFAGKDLVHQVLTQAEVNAIVASMKPIPYPAIPQP